MHWIVAIVTLASACGRIGFEPSDDGGSQTADTALDAALPPFGAPVLIPALSNPADEGDPSVTADRLEMVFVSTRSGFFDLYTSRRSDPGAPWGAPQPITELNGPDVDGTPDISPDGLELVFCSIRPGGLGLVDLYVSTRADRLSPWGTPVRITALGSVADEGGPTLDAARTTIVFESTRGGGLKASDLYLATRANTAAAWSAPVSIAELNSPASDQDAHFPSSDRFVVFASARAGGSMRDLYVSTRDTGPFSAPQILAGFGTPADETDPWMSPDLRYLVFASNVSGNLEIYEVSR